MRLLLSDCFSFPQWKEDGMRISAESPVGRGWGGFAESRKHGKFPFEEGEGATGEM